MASGPAARLAGEIAAKTRQEHDCPSQAWRISCARRTAAERLNAAIKDTAVNSIDRGWIRLTGVTPAHAPAGLPDDRPQPAHPARPGQPV